MSYQTFERLERLRTRSDSWRAGCWETRTSRFGGDRLVFLSFKTWPLTRLRGLFGSGYQK
jgi:hypothetical protein